MNAEQVAREYKEWLKAIAERYRREKEQERVFPERALK